MRTDDIEMYLRELPAPQRSALQALRETIAAAAPEAEEGKSYGLPAFRFRDRPLVSFAAHREHLSFYPMAPEVLDRYRERLAGFAMEKGTVRFTPDRPIPPEIVTAIVRDRVAMLEASGRRR